MPFERTPATGPPSSPRGTPAFVLRSPACPHSRRPSPPSHAPARAFPSPASHPPPGRPPLTPRYLLVERTSRNGTHYAHVHDAFLQQLAAAAPEGVLALRRQEGFIAALSQASADEITRD